MTTSSIEDQLKTLFEQWAKEPLTSILPIAPSGSNRIYFRLKSKNKSAIGTHNSNRQENDSFLSFSRHFKGKSLPVPTIYAEDLDQHIYLQEDLGLTSLYDLLPNPGEMFSDDLFTLYQKAVTQLAHLQVKGAKGLDFSKCFPRVDFDKQSMLWDFNYFKYYFLKLADVSFDEQAIEKDAHQLADFLLQTDTSHFMFRDFQSRNIMIKDGEPIFIDYQGGRRGAPQYDLASLLFQAKANLSEEMREQLLKHYLDTLETLIPVNREEFIQYYYGYVFMRCIQVLGAYGFRGLYEKREHFIQSIPFALRNMNWLLKNQKIDLPLPALKKALEGVITSDKFQSFDQSKSKDSPLVVRVSSFSYLQTGVPADPSGNGGGFVFDCRFIHNPGRYQPYKKLTGRDESVINFLQQKSCMKTFLDDVFRIVDEAVENYIEREFANLQVNFGCTGGQHRSVYAADALTKHLTEKYGIAVALEHIEQEKKNWVN